MELTTAVAESSRMMKEENIGEDDESNTGEEEDAVSVSVNYHGSTVVRAFWCVVSVEH